MGSVLHPGLKQRCTAIGLALLAVVLGLPAVQLAQPSALAATGDLAVSGHGWGHRRGLGQYGALGYAIDEHWNTDQIVSHFYGGTTASTVSPTTPVTVRILSHSTKPLIVQVDNGDLATLLPGQSPVGATGRALKIEYATGGFKVSDGATCAGPWTARTGTVSGTELQVRPAAIGSITFSYGRTGDIPLTGDWDGDGKDSVGVFRAGQFFLRNGAGGGPSDLSFGYGKSGDQPVVGDWNGDGKDTVGVRRGNSYYLRNTNTGGVADITFGYGIPGDTPIVGDWDGNGTDTPGVRRGSSWYLRDSNTSGNANHSLSFGKSTDAPMAGDWDGIGGDGVGVRRGTTYYLLNPLTTGPASATFTALGAGGPVAGSWKGAAPDYVGRFSAGAWEEAGAPNGGGGIDLPDPSNLTLDHTLQLCNATSAGGYTTTATSTRYYRGDLRAERVGTSLETVNGTGIDWYLRGVVPSESPASWGSIDCPGEVDCGRHALEAQAIAARSYALRENRTAYAKTCDTTSCQVYRGRAYRTSGGSPVLFEATQSSAAVTATPGFIRRMPDSSIASTEFSSSTGGFTAGGVYPAVQDLGDDTASNPNHNWAITLTAQQLQVHYGKGALQSTRIVSRSAVDGRAVTQVELVFLNGTVTATGEAFRQTWSLKSSWFAFG